MKKKHHKHLNIKNLVKCFMLITQNFNELKNMKSNKEQKSDSIVGKIKKF